MCVYKTVYVSFRPFLVRPFTCLDLISSTWIRDGWISVEDIRRLCRNLKYDLKEDEEKAICSIGCGRGGGTYFCISSSNSGSKSTSKGVLNFRDFAVFVQKSKVEKNDKQKKLKPCVIQ